MTSCPNSPVKDIHKITRMTPIPCNCLANFRIATEVIYKQTITGGYMNDEKCIGMWRFRLASTFGGTSRDGGHRWEIPTACCPTPWAPAGAMPSLCIRALKVPGWKPRIVAAPLFPSTVEIAGNLPPVNRLCSRMISVSFVLAEWGRLHAVLGSNLDAHAD